MSKSDVLLRVTSIRSVNPQGRGGAIFSGVEVDATGSRTDATASLVVKAPHWLLGSPVEVGQLWKVTGTAEANTIVVNGYRLTEATVTPTAMELLRPSGEHIVTLLAESKAFRGIGYAKARRLWDHFGEALYGVLDNGLEDRLAEVLTTEAAADLIEAWRDWGESFTLQWLQSKGFPVALGRRVMACLGRDAAKQIEEDPYRLISFTAKWSITDALARSTFGIAEDDPRRLAGAVEEALYAAFDAGHTCIEQAELERRLRRLLGRNAGLLAEAIQQAEAAARFVRREGMLHAAGPWVMERGVAEAIASRSVAPSYLIQPSELAPLLERYEASAGITLHERQALALGVANANPLAIITGGAGTGKTTVLRGLIHIAEAADWPVYLIALSGRASKRMAEATGHAAQTIAGFLQRFDADDAPKSALVIVDEASMVDLPAAYRLLRHLPATYRFVLVGDPNQLPPVGPGLLLHELVHPPGIPRVELTAVKRYGGEIAEAAAAIRDGCWPALPCTPTAPISFLPCELDRLNDTVLALYQEERESQILCATRNATEGGVKALNTLCQARLNPDGEELRLWNLEHEQQQRSGFRVGDPVICLKNDWDIDLQNGSLGRIVAVAPPLNEVRPARVLGRIRWDDGRTLDLTAALLPHLELAYAITVHKSQGSQFGRVIIPVRPSRLLDRTLLYTAVTRAERHVILIGDPAAAKAAVEGVPHAARRKVGLGELVVETLEASP